MENKTPSDFLEFPSSSVTGKYEKEMVACNIMVILTRQSNRFRDLIWKEYKYERLKDKNFSNREHDWFDNVINYCKNEDTARLFSPVWDKVFTEEG